MKKEHYLTFNELTSQHFEPTGWYYEAWESDFLMKPHLHPQYEIMYCEWGAISVELYDKRNSVPIKAQIPEKCFILLNTGSYHKLKIDTPIARIFNIELLPQNEFPNGTAEITKKFTPSAHEIFSMSPQLSKIQRNNNKFYTFIDSHDVGGTMRKLVSTLLESDHPKTDITARMLITELFLDISYCSFIETDVQSESMHVRKAQLFMKQNFNKPISVEDIAEATGVSSAYLQRLFKAELSESIFETLTKIRLKKAEYLLENTGFSNSEIAALSGFGTLDKFMYAFKRFNQCSPRTFKQANFIKHMRSEDWPPFEELDI